MLEATISTYYTSSIGCTTVVYVEIYDILSHVYLADDDFCIISIHHINYAHMHASDIYIRRSFLPKY